MVRWQEQVGQSLAAVKTHNRELQKLNVAHALSVLENLFPEEMVGDGFSLVRTSEVGKLEWVGTVYFEDRDCVFSINFTPRHHYPMFFDFPHSQGPYRLRKISLHDKFTKVAAEYNLFELSNTYQLMYSHIFASEFVQYSKVDVLKLDELRKAVDIMWSLPADAHMLWFQNEGNIVGQSVLGYLAALKNAFA